VRHASFHIRAACAIPQPLHSYASLKGPAGHFNHLHAGHFKDAYECEGSGMEQGPGLNTSWLIQEKLVRFEMVMDLELH